MKAIYKFRLTITGEQKIPLTAGAKILSVGEQFDNVVLWAICEPKKDIEERKIYIFGTGHPLPDNINQRSFIGTVTTDAGNYVWHIFE